MAAEGERNGARKARQETQRNLGGGCVCLQPADGFFVRTAQAYRERVCRGSKHEMPRWCKGSAGPGGKYAHELDDAEKGWIEQAGRRQESKQTLLVNHKAYLKEARIQVKVSARRAVRGAGRHASERYAFDCTRATSPAECGGAGGLRGTT